LHTVPVAFSADSELVRNSVVLEYMNQWRAEGYADWINRVRGGTYSMINLPAHQIQTLQDQLNHATRACMICGGTNHYASQCQRRNYPRNPITSRSSMSLSPRMNDPDSSEDSDSAYESETLMHGDLRRYSRSIPSRTSDQYGRVNQYARFYYSGTNNANRCFRCGRAGHFASSCFARVHVDGTLLKQSYNTIYDSESDWVHVKSFDSQPRPDMIPDMKVYPKLYIWFSSNHFLNSMNCILEEYFITENACWTPIVCDSGFTLWLK